MERKWNHFPSPQKKELLELKKEEEENSVELPGEWC
jgi:hypothetical protein